MVVPVGNPAMTLNFFSAVLGALGACLLAANLWLLLRNSGQTYRLTATLAGAFAFAFSKSYWSASLAAKGGIYVLQVDLELAFFYFLQLHFLGTGTEAKTKGGARGSLALLIFLFALGLTNHWPTQLLTLPALGTLAFVKGSLGARTHRKPTVKTLIHTLAFTFLVLCLYLYLPLRANHFPALNFGAALNSHRFLACLFRVDYSKVETLASASPAEFSALGAKALYLSDHFLDEYNGIFLLLAAFGLWGLLRKGWERHALFLLMLLLTTLVVNVFYLRVIPIEFWHLDDHTLSLNWALGIFGGVGIGGALEWLRALGVSKGRLMARAGICFLVVATLPALLLFKHLDVNDQSREFLYWGYGMTALESMDQNARYFAESDYDYFSILYLREVEHRRPDVGLRMTTFLTDSDWVHLVKEVSSGSSLPGYPLYCAFSNGDFINGYLQRSKTASFMPSGTITEFMPPKFSKRDNLLQPLDQFWDRYLASAVRHANPINGLLLELCAHPYLDTAQFLRLRNDYSRWDTYPGIASALIQDNHWLGDIWAEKGSVDKKMGRTKEALGDFGLALVEYQQAGDLQKYNEAFQTWSQLKNQWESKTKNPAPLSRGRVR